MSFLYYERALRVLTGWVGRRGSLLLHCNGLAPSTPCRFAPAFPSQICPFYPHLPRDV